MRSSTPLRSLIAVAVVFSMITYSARADAQGVEIEVNGTRALEDDYLCWTPVSARLRAPTGLLLGDGRVVIGSESDPGGGEIEFGVSESRPNRSDYNPSPTLSLELPKDGSWVDFWISGKSSSTGRKDVAVVVTSNDGTKLGSLPLMVRVRKDAEKLTNFEIQLFLDALVALNKSDGGSDPSIFGEFAQIHQAANQLQIHRSPLFLPWHRALLLDFERRLQEIDQRVTVPYWRFDLPAKRVFSADFMGVTKAGTDFEPGGAMARWLDPILGPLIRAPAADPSDGVIPAPKLESFDGRYIVFRGQLESRFHSGVHARIGGWLASPASPADPLFFLLHANVDRIWAHWQTLHDRLNQKDELTYSSQGAYPGVGPDQGVYGKGVYAEDGMWPWSFDPSASNSGEWPAIIHPMPKAMNEIGAWPVTPGNMIDFMNVTGDGLALGYCYDDIDFMGRIGPKSP